MTLYTFPLGHLFPCRMSLPFFYEPHFDANINVKIPPKLLPAVPSGDFTQLPDMPYASFLLNKLPIYTEYAKINDALPEWMRKKYLENGLKHDCWATKHGIKVDGMNYESMLKQSENES